MARHEPGAMIGYPELTVDKGLKRGALGLIASIVIGVASTAPAGARDSWAESSTPGGTDAGQEGRLARIPSGQWSTMATCATS
jgi:hypothetical protein